MGFEQIPNIDRQRRELDKEHAELNNKEYITPDDIEEKKKIEKEHQKLSDQVKEIEKGKSMEKIDKQREELDEKYTELENKEFKTPEDIEEIARIEKEHKELSEQSKKIDGKKEEKEKKIAPEDLEKSISKAKNFEDLIKVIEKSGGIQGSRDFWSIEELKGFIDLARNGVDTIHITRTGGLRKKVEELIEEEKKKKVEKKEGSKKEKGEDKKEKSKKEKKIEDPWESYRKHSEAWKEFQKAPDHYEVTNICLEKNSKELNNYLKQSQSKLSKEASIWIKEEIKTKKEEEMMEERKKPEEEKQPKRKRAKAEDIKWKKTEIDKKETDKILKGAKEKQAKGKERKEKKEKLEKKDAWSKIEKVIQDPESMLQSFIENPEKLAEVSEILKDSITQKKIKKLIGTKEYQALSKRIEKLTKEKGKIPDSAAKAKEHIEKKESPWGTAFGAAGWGILLFLVLFILAELKGIETLSGQATGKKEKKK